VKERCIVIPAVKKNAVIPDQLVKKLAGVTLVERAINTARSVLPGDDIMVLTDSQEIALICERAGVRHHWNKDLRFTSLDIVAEMRGLLAELAREYEHCLILRASCPLLTWVDVEDAWKRYSEAQADSLVTVKSMRQRIWNVQGEGLESLLDEDAGHDSEKTLVGGKPRSYHPAPCPAAGGQRRHQPGAARSCRIFSTTGPSKFRGIRTGGYASTCCSGGMWSLWWQAGPPSAWGTCTAR